MTRSVRYPYWCSCRYWYAPLSSETKEIANGETTTAVDGKFELDFTAEPDNSVKRENEPVFTYTIYADVTDSAGETRSTTQRTSVGYTSLQASLSADKWLTATEDLELKLKVTTLDDEGVTARGTLKIFKLQSPEKVSRTSFNNHNPRANAGQNMNAWATGEVVSSDEVATDESGKLTWQTKLEAGAFKAVFESADPAGNKISAEQILLVNNVDSDQFAIKIPNHFQAKQDSVEPGEEFLAIWGTGYDSGQAFIEIEHRGKTVRSWWTDAAKSQTAIRIPIEEKHRGGLHLRITFVKENRCYPTVHRIDVPWSNKKLNIKWEHFTSKLQPGGRETWTAVVSGPDAEAISAEMVAGMYDASLDAFAPHSWRSSFSGFYVDYSNASLQFCNRLNNANTVHRYQKPHHRDDHRYYRNFKGETGLANSREFYSASGGYQGMYRYDRFQAGQAGSHTRKSRQAMSLPMAEYADAKGLHQPVSKGEKRMMELDSAAESDAVPPSLSLIHI